MAKQRTVLRVMVGSPGDVAEERELLEAAVRDVVIATSKSTQVHLELVRWETHAYPDFASDPQDVINQQLDDDYDIFIGILWTRFGTPTGRADSGTEEEFRRAYQRHKTDSKSIRIMIYFKTSPVAPESLDPDQLKLLNGFRSELGARGGLYWKYGDSGEFDRLIRMHLTQQVQAWGKTWGEPGNSTVLHTAANSVAGIANAAEHKMASGTDEGEDEGFLELIETGSENMEEFKSCATRITTAMAELTKKVVKRASTADKLMGPGKPSMARAKAIMDRTAKDMDDFAIATEADVAIFGNSITTALDAYARSAVMASRFAGGTERIQQALSEIRSITPAATEARDGMTVFRTGVASVPPLTSTLLRAKKRVLAVLDKLDVEFAKAINLLGGLDSMLSSVDGAPSE